VHRVDAEGITVELVNLSPDTARTLTIQAGMFGEHTFTTATQEENETSVNGSHLTLTLAPGAAGTVRLGMNLYQNQPAYAFPWQR
jgi:hypothetical protein